MSKHTRNLCDLTRYHKLSLLGKKGGNNTNTDVKPEVVDSAVLPASSTGPRVSMKRLADLSQGYGGNESESLCETI